MNKLTQQELDKLKVDAIDDSGAYFSKDYLEFGEYVKWSSHCGAYGADELSAIEDAVYSFANYYDESDVIKIIYDYMNENEDYSSVGNALTCEEEDIAGEVLEKLHLERMQNDTDLCESQIEKLKEIELKFLAKCHEFLSKLINDITLDEINKHIEERMT